jgi:hypothetical protein
MGNGTITVQQTAGQSWVLSHRVGFKPNPMGWIMGFQNGFNHLFMFQYLMILNGFDKPLKWFE